MQKDNIFIIAIVVLFKAQFFSQNYQIDHHQMLIGSTVTDKLVNAGDTIKILDIAKKYNHVDLSSPNLYNIEYDFLLPDSLPDGTYGAFYDKKKKNLIFIVTYKGKKKNGAFKFFHNNSNVRCMGFFVDNYIDKVYIEYNNRGKLTTVSNYSNGLLNGAKIDFDADGKNFSTLTNYKNGKRDGTFLQYKYNKNNFPELLYEFKFKDGLQVGDK